MRLEHLRITAVGPFAGTEEIDFAALTRGGLFLLEGPTGAGKSTVLDAITFALFGQPAAEGTSADRLRSHFAPPDTAPEVQLTFSVHGRRMRLTRTPEHDRPKKRGDGTTRQKATVHLEADDGGSWVSVSSNHNEVGREIEDRVGLNREQFTKVVLLPQGEFATFLRAGAKDRADVLTQIFGTAFYDSVTDLLVEWRTAARREREQADLSVGKAVAALGAAAGLDEVQRAELEAALATSGDHVLAALESALVASVAEAADAEGLAAARRTDLQQRLDALAETRAAHADLADYLARRARHEADADAHAVRVHELARARAAAPVGVVVRQLDEAHRRLDDQRAVLLGLPLDLRGDESASDADRLDALARELDDTAAELRPVAALEAALVERRATATAYDAEIDTFESRAKVLEVRRLELPSLIEDIDAEVARLTALAATLPALESAHDAAQNRLTAARSLVTVERELASASAARTAAHAAHLDAKEHRLSVLEAHLKGMAAELASHLADGAPCPVCGGTDHPAPARIAPGHVTRAHVDDAERVEAAAAAELEAATQALAQLEKRQSSLAAQAEGYDVDTAATQLGAVVAELEVARAAVPALDAARIEVASLRAEAAASEKAESETRLQLARLTTEREQALAGILRDENTIRLALGDFDTVADRIESLHARARHTRTGAAAVRDLDSARTTVLAKEHELSLVAAEAGFDDPSEAQAAVRSASQVAALDDAVSAWESQSVVLAELGADPRFAALNPTESATVAASFAEVETECAAAGREVQLAQAERTRREQRLLDLRAHRARLVACRDERDTVYADTAAIDRIAGLAKGTSGSPRMSLSTYVLRRWFDSVVEAANLRLDRMSAGRYQLERTDEVERKVEQAGLGLVVIDLHTGEVRSPRSLSGGETFYTSLALALGLADVVRAEAGGVDLDTLFIDEGFGTLDAEALELVMDVIDDLRDGGRAVGIVSHVADLKDQITERLEIRRTSPQGPSTTRIVA
ncbi:MAG: SMC family ATPase [Candidatus Nanopelagicales bacterium]